MNRKKRIVIGVSGASGTILAIRVLEILRSVPEWETHLVITPSALVTLRSETDYTEEFVYGLADVVYDVHDMAAAISSGSFLTEGMIIVPCSMKTAAGIASGYSDNLLLRAADVTLKERRKLALVVRESPLSQIHLNNLLLLSKCGAIIMPPVMTFYNQPTTIDDMVNYGAGRLLGYFEIKVPGLKRWCGNER